MEAYGWNLKDKLSQLVESMKSKQYRPKPVKRVYIPKTGKNEKRGLGIPSVEDKLVQIMLKKILAGVAFFLYFCFKSVAKYMYKLLQSDKTHFTF